MPIDFVLVLQSAEQILGHAAVLDDGNGAIRIDLAAEDIAVNEVAILAALSQRRQEAIETDGLVVAGERIALFAGQLVLDEGFNDEIGGAVAVGLFLGVGQLTVEDQFGLCHFAGQGRPLHAAEGAGAAGRNQQQQGKEGDYKGKKSLWQPSHVRKLLAESVSNLPRPKPESIMCIMPLPPSREQGLLWRARGRFFLSGCRWFGYG